MVPVRFKRRRLSDLEWEWRLSRIASGFALPTRFAALWEAIEPFAEITLLQNWPAPGFGVGTHRTLRMKVTLEAVLYF